MSDPGLPPGRAADLERLLALEALTERHRRGRVVFVAGDAGSGRTSLLRALRRSLEGAADVVVIAGTMEAGEFGAWTGRESSLRRAARTLEAVMGAVGPLLPVLQLAAQVIAQSKAAWSVVSAMRERQELGHPLDVLPRLLRAAAEDRPVVCLVDDADRASAGWWTDLVLTFAQEIAADLPLLLVLAVDGPAELGLHEDDEPEMLFAARRLTERRLADWVPLARATHDDLAGWIGQVDAAVVRALHDVTAGRSAWAAQLWEDWRRSGRVTDETPDLHWRFAPGGAERAVPVPSELIARRLRDVLPPGDVAAVDLARELLACAALEGRRFTVDALALALGRDREEVIDFLDDGVMDDDPSSGAMLAEAGLITIDDGDALRHLWLGRFVSELDWLTLRHYGLTGAERRARSLDLARALSETYGGAAHLVAHQIARLFEAGGEPEAAGHFRRMGSIGVDRSAIVWRALQILRAPDPETPADRRRATDVLLAAGSALYEPGPFPLGLEVADALHRFGAAGEERTYGLYLRAWFHTRVRRYDEARRELEQVLASYETLRDPEGIANARHQLALLDLLGGDPEAARPQFLEVLEMRRELRDRGGEATVAEALGMVDLRLGDHAAARGHFLEALEIVLELKDRQREASLRAHLGEVERADGNRSAFREQTLAALHLYREGVDPAGESLAVWALAADDYEQGRQGEALPGFLRVRELARAIGHTSREGGALALAARVHAELGDAAAARAAYREAADLLREAGDAEGEAEALAALED